MPCLRQYADNLREHHLAATRKQWVQRMIVRAKAINRCTFGQGIRTPNFGGTRTWPMYVIWQIKRIKCNKQGVNRSDVSQFHFGEWIQKDALLLVRHMRKKEPNTKLFILEFSSCDLIGKCKGLGNSLQAGHYVDKLSFQEKLFTIGTKYTCTIFLEYTKPLL